MLIKRFLNKLGLVTAGDLLAIETDLELLRMSQQDTVLEYNKLADRVNELERQALTKDTFIIDDWFDFDSYRDHVDEWIEQDLSQRDYWSVGDHLDLTEHFSLCDWDLLDSDDIESLVNDKVEESALTKGQIEDWCSEVISESDVVDVDDIAEQVTNIVCERIGGAILGLTHEEPTPANLPTPYVDPVLQQIIEEPQEPQERDKLIDPLMDILNEL